MSKWETARGWALARMLIVSTWNLGECFFGRFYSSEDLPCLQCMLFFAGLKLSTIVVYLVVWVGLDSWDALKKEDCYFRVPRFESQTTGPQTTNLLLVEIVVMFSWFFWVLPFGLLIFQILALYWLSVEGRKKPRHLPLLQGEIYIPN